MRYSFGQRGLAAASLAVFVAVAAPVDPASAQSTRDKVLSIVADSMKATGASEVTWGTPTGDDARFTIPDFKATLEKDGKSATFTAGEVAYTNAKPSADGGFTADLIAATDVEFDSDDADITAGSLTLTNYVGTAPDKLRAKNAAGERFDRVEAHDVEVTDENDKTVPIASIVVTAGDYAGDYPHRIGFEMKGMTVPVDPGDESMKDIAELGYESLALDAAFTGTWDDKAGRITVDQLSIAGADVGGLKLAFSLGGVTPEVVDGFRKAEGDQGKQMELLQGLTVEKLSLRYEDASLAKRLIDAQAKKQDLPPEALVQQLDALVPMMVSTIGNKDFEKKIAAAASAFLKAPKSLTVSAAPAKPTPVAEIMGAAMMAPQSLPTVLGADVKAND